MKVLIQLTTTTELITYEALSLAMTMATFDHEVQLTCSLEVLVTALQPKNRLHGMLQSLELYDIQPMWLLIDAQSADLANNLLSIMPVDIAEQVIVTDSQSMFSAITDFDSVLTF